MEQPGISNVSVIENRVRIQGLVLKEVTGKSVNDFFTVSIDIFKIERVQDFPDLLSAQRTRIFELYIHTTNILKLDDIIGRRISCIVSWAPFGRLFMLKDTLEVI